MPDKQFKIDKGGFSFRSIGRGLLLFIMPITAYIIGLLPILIIYVKISSMILLSGIISYLLFTILIVFCFLFFIIFETFIPGLFIKIFRIKVKEGEYDLSIKDKGFFNHLLFFTLYRPSLHLIGIIPLVPMRLLYLKIVGLKIGKNSMIAGTELIDEPFAVHMGNNTLIGGFSIIFTHISHKKMITKYVKIGNNCFIGNKSVIMPGVVIEDDVIVKPNTVVEMYQILKKGGIYQGNPARRINK
jgi:acetyltransferase-like isoleucine patch superfamily enzyme